MIIDFVHQASLDPQRYSALYQHYYKVLKEVIFYVMIIVKYLTTEYKISSHIHIKYHAFYRTMPKIRKRNSWPQQRT